MTVFRNGLSVTKLKVMFSYLVQYYILYACKLCKPKHHLFPLTFPDDS